MLFFREFTLATCLRGIDKAETHKTNNGHVAEGHLEAEPIVEKSVHHHGNAEHHHTHRAQEEPLTTSALDDAVVNGGKTIEPH